MFIVVTMINEEVVRLLSGSLCCSFIEYHVIFHAFMIVWNDERLTEMLFCHISFTSIVIDNRLSNLKHETQK
ncbi:hypothetical protein Plhal304r1_c004g0017851 [Plasmopara halstedii]